MHKNSRGLKQNRLIYSRSPYLLQHAENPVDWYEWGEQAFTRAKDENLPVLLSIGYATCHWCHVMAEESFEDNEVAELLNKNFVCIKVDREERPDIDDFYMTVAQLLNGSGGWPLNIFMTPEKQPFMAITYLPKQAKNGISGFSELLANIAAIWRQRPDMVENNCKNILEQLASISNRKKISSKMEAKDLSALSVLAFKQLSSSYDQEYGGFGRSPKFPMPINICWLIENGQKYNPIALDMALNSLLQIRSGGIWDQLDGGLHRYSVDRRWLVPHFEKMLYDQAMLAIAALDALSSSGNIQFKEQAENILSFVQKKLTAPDGGFYSALDADSEGVEGKCYLWKKQEIEAYLKKDSALFCKFYGVTLGGNFEDNNILTRAKHIADFCLVEKLDPVETGLILEKCRLKLLAQRNRRVQPLRDEKIIASWNGLMIAAFARAGITCNKPEFLQIASDAAKFIIKNLRRSDGRLLRSFLGEASDIPAFLEDYAFMAFGFLELFEATLDKSWLEQATSLSSQMIELFCNPEDGQFSKTGKDAEQMLLEASIEHDGVIPSAFSMTATLFIRISRSAGSEKLLKHARNILETTLTDAKHQPVAHLLTLQALDRLEQEPFEAHFKGDYKSAAMQKLLSKLRSYFIPNLSITIQESDNLPTVSICAKGSCHPAVSDVDKLAELLEMVTGR